MKPYLFWLLNGDFVALLLWDVFADLLRDLDWDLDWDIFADFVRDVLAHFFGDLLGNLVAVLLGHGVALLAGDFLGDLKNHKKSKTTADKLSFQTCYLDRMLIAVFPGHVIALVVLVVAVADLVAVFLVRSVALFLVLGLVNGFVICFALQTKLSNFGLDFLQTLLPSRRSRYRISDRKPFHRLSCISYRK